MSSENSDLNEILSLEETTRSEVVAPSVVRYIQKRMEGLSKFKAAVAAGYSESVARIASVKIEKTSVYQKALDDLWPEEFLLMKMAEGFEANKPDKFGKPYADFETRRKYLELAFKLKGRLKGAVDDVEKEDPDKTNYNKEMNLDWERKIINVTNKTNSDKLQSSSGTDTDPFGSTQI
jgi:hypothetical protein